MLGHTPRNLCNPVPDPKRSVPSSGGPSPVGRSSHVRALASSYSDGRDLYADQFLQASETMSGTPLERAYLWVLSCESALTERVLRETFMCASRRRFPGRVQVAPPAQLATDPRPHIATAGARRSRRIASSRGRAWTMAMTSAISDRASCTTASRTQQSECSIVPDPLSRSRSVLQTIGPRIHGPMCSTSRAAVARGQVAPRA